MPETKGVVTELIRNPKKNNKPFGIKVAGEEYLYSFENRRGEPFDEDKVEVGSFVRLVWEPFEKDGKEKRYVQVLECAVDVEAYVEGMKPDELPPVARETPLRGWDYQHKDILMFIESCAKGACTIYAAALQGGQLKEFPKHGEITDLARSLEEHGAKRFKALLDSIE